MAAAPGALSAAGSVPLVVVDRSGFEESVHQGAAVVVAPDGGVLRALGDPAALVYPRSALKPFQTVAALRAGARLDDDESLVIVTSSHTGTPRHVALVERVLERAGLTPAHLRTPEAWPSSSSAARERVRAGLGPARITMNCSGNHAGMLAGAAASGWSVDDYLDAGHPMHDLAAEVIGELTGAGPAARGVDGCGGPVWAVPLTALALGYQGVARVEPRIAAAVRREPEVVEGPGTATSRAVAALGVFAKSGAEGVFCAVAPDGTAVAVKTLDGSGRAAAAVSIALLAAAGALDAGEASAFLADPSLAVLGGGAEVGRIRPLVA